MEICQPWSRPECGCIAHRAVIISKATANNAGYVGQTALELDSLPMRNLIFLHNWPDKFRNMYYKTPAKAGIARIDHFIKTKGRE